VLKAEESLVIEQLLVFLLAFESGFLFSDESAVQVLVQSRQLEPLLPDEFDGRTVHLETEAEWLRTISKDVAQMCFTVGAGAALERLFVLEDGVDDAVSWLRHFEAIISELYCVLHRVPKSGVTRSVDVLMLIQEEVLLANNALVVAHVLRFPVGAGECAFGALLLGDPVLEGREPLAVGSLHFHFLLLEPSVVDIDIGELAVCLAVFFEEVHLGHLSSLLIDSHISHLLQD